MTPAGVAPALIVIEPQLPLEFLVGLFRAVALLEETNQRPLLGPRRQGAQIELHGVPIVGLLHHQPEWFLKGALGDQDASKGEVRPQWLLGSLSPREFLEALFAQLSRQVLGQDRFASL